ncbi:hypothetical protein IG193_08530 [Infirmifilum lucidum]|uniref:ECF transporter S component n=1 Tax=Infirmifilum lucidum TaxID=2776706 RepID=A0A7L9FG34_9CREN|nr:hypothetical protein [Infirmifilum lucidum]QOJ78778.1 hypothetical protein IG193_08530 [Infirmifilum lucidum]
MGVPLKSPAFRLSLATTMGVSAFLSKVLLPTPYDKLAIVLHAYLLALSSFILGGLGATYTGLIIGILVSWWRSAFFPLSLAMDVFYGLTVDLFLKALRARERGAARQAALAVAAGSAVTGLLSMTVAVAAGFMRMNPVLYALIPAAGSAEGAVAGYLASVTWDKYLSRSLRSYGG